MRWTVLCVSKISPAQITRNMILERAGYQVIAIDDPGEAERIFKTSVVDAVVFGDSINGEQRLALARTFKAVNSTVPIVALNKTGGSRMPAGLIDEQLESLGDPHLLVEALNRALSRDGDGAAQAAPAHKQALQDGNNPVKPASSFTDGQASNTKSDSKTQKNSSF